MKYLLLLTLLSCSTLKKSITYSALTGAIAGGASGYVLSPDKESKGANSLIFGVVGAAIMGTAGYLLYEEDPRNKKLKPMIDGFRGLKENQVGIDLGGIKIEASLDKGDVYSSPKKALPKELQGKVKDQFIIKYQSKERYINKDNKTYYVPSFEIYEHAYESLGEKDE